MKHKLLVTSLSSAFALFMTASSANANAVITFQELADGSLYIFAEGVLDLNPATTGFVFNYGADLASFFSDSFLGQDGDGIDYRSPIGTFARFQPNPVNHPTVVTPWRNTSIVASVSSSFGYRDGTALSYDVNDVTGGTVIAPTQITWTEAKDFAILANTTLADIQLATQPWTGDWRYGIIASSGDELIFRAIAIPIAIPEPSTSLLAGLGLMCVLTRRSRRS